MSTLVSYQPDYSEILYERGNTDALLWLRPHPAALLPAGSVLFLSSGRDSHLGSLGRGREDSLLLN